MLSLMIINWRSAELSLTTLSWTLSKILAQTTLNVLKVMTKMMILHQTLQLMPKQSTLLQNWVSIFSHCLSQRIIYSPYEKQSQSITASCLHLHRTFLYDAMTQPTIWMNLPHFSISCHMSTEQIQIARVSISLMMMLGIARDHLYSIDFKQRQQTTYVSVSLMTVKRHAVKENISRVTFPLISICSNNKTRERHIFYSTESNWSS